MKFISHVFTFSKSYEREEEGLSHLSFCPSGKTWAFTFSGYGDILMSFKVQYVK